MARRRSGRPHGGCFIEALEPRILLADNFLITEFMADNTHTLQDYEGDYSDWIEIYNADPVAHALAGYHLTDSTTNLTKWEFPAATLGGDSYLVVFASGKNRVFTWTDAGGTHTEYHTNFKLGADGEYLALVAPDGATVVSQYATQYPRQVPDVSYGLSTAASTSALVAPGAAAKWLVPAAQANLDPNWKEIGFNEAGWSSGTTGIGYDVYAVPAPSGAGTFYYGPFGPGGTWHLYEVVATLRTWKQAYDDASTRYQSGVQGHLVTIASAAENQFVKTIIAQDAWLGLTDSETMAGTHEYADTSGWPAPTEGQVPASNERGAGFVWVTAEPFTYHLNVWADSPSQPDNAGTRGQDAVMMAGPLNSTYAYGSWTDERDGNGTQTGVSKGYVVEYDLNLASMGPGFTVLEKHDPAIVDLASATQSLDAGGGTYYPAPFINYIDPEDYGEARFGGSIPFAGDTPGDTDHFALRITGTVRIPSAGAWTFGVNSDDGFRLKITGAAFTAAYGSGTTCSGDTMTLDGLRGPADSLGVCTLGAGDFSLELDFFENTGGSGIEFFAAAGAKNTFDASFKLVGDTRSGGLALLDVKDLVATNIQAAMKGVNASACLRIPFTVGDLGAIRYLTLRMKYDDGFVAYVNGHEAERAGAPDTVLWNSAAAAEHPDSRAVAYEDFDISDMTGYLVPGTNVLAIQGLNLSAGDGDLLILPELDATSGRYGTSRRYFVTPTPGARNGTGTADLGPVVTDVSQPAAAPGDDDQIAVTAGVRASINPLAAGTVTLRYRVMWDPEVALAMYDDGAHGDGAAADGVYGAAIPAGASTPGQMVRWYVTAADTQGKTGRWPLFDDTSGPQGTGSPEYCGTMIADGVAGTMPILDWFVQDPAAAADTGRGGTDASIYYDGEFFDNVFCRFRGGYATGGTKVDFNKGYYFRWDADHRRVSEINLNCQGGLAPDDAWVRPIVAFEAYRDAGCPASEAFMVRVQQASPGGISAVFRVAVEQVDDEYLKRQGLYGDGALYKMVGDVPQMTDAFSFQKKNRTDETDRADLQAFLDGLHLADPVARMRYIFDHVDIPQFLDYQAATVIIQEMDSAQKNYYLYCDTRDQFNPNGTGEWMMLPWDEHLTFGKNFGIADYEAVDPQAHPFFADSEHPKIDGPWAWNYMIDALLDVPEIKQMYLRRLRTVMDKLLQPAGTPYDQRYFENRLDELYAQLAGDPQFAARYGDLKWAFDDIKNKYLGDWYDGSRWWYGARTHFYVDHSANAYYPDFAGIPLAELGSPPIGFGALDYNPASGNQEEEYIELVNPNPFAVDISGWRLAGGISYTFRDGVVIPAGGSLYVSPDVAAFRARATGPGGSQGLFVQGNYDGHLTNWGETLRLLDDRGAEIDTFAYAAAPSLPQQYLRVTEVMYHPAGATQGSGFNDDDFEYLELKNISAGQALDLAGVKFAEGVFFDFAGSRVASLAPGAYVLVVGSQAAFQSRYGHACDGIIAGQFAAGNLNNGGEQIRLLDAANDTILSFNYGDKWYYNTDGEGFSLTVRDPAAPDRGLWDSPDGWRPSRLAGGSPGTGDADLAPGAVEINEVLAHQDTEPPGDWVELKNTTASPIDLAGWYLSDHPVDPADPQQADYYRIAAGANHPSTVIQPGGFMVLTESADFGPAACATGFALSELGDTIYLSSVVSPGATTLAGFREVQTLSASDGEVPFTRYAKSTGGIDFAAESAKTPGAPNACPLVGPVVVGGVAYSPGVIFSEIMYHPAPGGDEFIELRNMTPVEVPLYDPAHPENTWEFTDGITLAMPAGATIPAGGYALVVPIPPETFRAKYGLPADLKIYGPYSGALANGGETIELARPGEPEGPPAGFVPYYRVDRLTYGDPPSWPGMADGRGSSLIRSVPSDYGDDVANWAAGNSGGTPGAPNAALDGTPPTAPTGLTAVLAGKTRIALAWSPASDPQTGVAYYYIYNYGAKIAAAPAASYSFTSVWPSADYSFQVSAANGDGVEGERSAATAVIHVAVLDSATAADQTTVNVAFTEALNRDSAQVPACYAVTDAGGSPLGVTAALLLPGQKRVALTLAAPLSQGVTYLVSAAGVMTKTGFPVISGSQAAFSYTVPVPGCVLREYWTGIGGSTVADLTGNPNYPNTPSGSDQLTSFEAPTNWGDNYGQRLRAYVTAPATGAYTFWIASDDASELWLSTDDSPANVRRIAYVSSWTYPRQWTVEANQNSANVVGAINLVAGRRYYVEALQKEGGGGDNLCVRWQLPGGTVEEPIPAGRLTIYVPVLPTISIQAVAPTAAEHDQQKGTFTITRTGSTARALTAYYTVTGTVQTADLREDLTGIAEIPAGAASVNIDVTPIDDRTPEPDETVRLALYPDTKYAIGASDATVTILDGTPPAVTGIELNGRADRSASAIDPGGSGIETIKVTFSQPVTFAAADVVLQTVAFNGNFERVTGALTPLAVVGSGAAAMIVTLPKASVADAWVKVTLKASGALVNLRSVGLDGESKGGSGRSYVYNSSDLPTGDGAAGGDAVFYVGSLRGDFESTGGAAVPDGRITQEDVDGFLARFAAQDKDADFRGAGFNAALPDGRVTAADLDGFLAVYAAAAAAGRCLAPLPNPGPQAGGEPGPLAASAPRAVTLNSAVLASAPALGARGLELVDPQPAPVSWGGWKQNAVLYCVYRIDPETGLDQVRNRYYHPTLWRLTTRDRAYYDGPNMYEYGKDGPGGLVDTFGLQCTAEKATQFVQQNTEKYDFTVVGGHGVSGTGKVKVNVVVPEQSAQGARGRESRHRRNPQKRRALPLFGRHRRAVLKHRPRSGARENRKDDQGTGRASHGSSLTVAGCLGFRRNRALVPVQPGRKVHPASDEYRASCGKDVPILGRPAAGGKIATNLWLVASYVWWRRVDLNHRPRAYESPALPLSYTASQRSQCTPKTRFVKVAMGLTPSPAESTSCGDL